LTGLELKKCKSTQFACLYYDGDFKEEEVEIYDENESVEFTGGWKRMRPRCIPGGYCRHKASLAMNHKYAEIVQFGLHAAEKDGRFHFTMSQWVFEKFLEVGS